MPSYYFHLHNHLLDARDEEGRELPDREAAVAAGLADIRAFLSEEVKSGQLDLRGHLRVVDEQGNLVATLSFFEAVGLRLPDDAE